MGTSPRGGAYTYDWIENLLGLNMHSADRVLPEYQRPQVGDTLGYGKNRMRFERVEPGACARASVPKTATGSGASCSTSTTEEPG